MARTSYPELLLCESNQFLRVMLGLCIRCNAIHFLDEFLHVRPSCDGIVVLYVDEEYPESINKWRICDVHQIELSEEERPIIKF